MKPTIGKFEDDGNALIDLPRLLETRMLIQANSGGGTGENEPRARRDVGGQTSDALKP